MSNRSPRKTIRLEGRILWLLAFSILTLSLFVVVMYQQKKGLETTKYLVNHSYDLIKKINDTRALVVEAEAATRSYMITGVANWKQELTRLHARAKQVVAEMRPDLLNGDARQEADFNRLQLLINNKEKFQNSVTSRSAITEAEANRITYRSEGAQLSTETKKLLSNMMQAEETLLINRIAENERSYNSSANTAVIGGVFAFLLILTVLVQLNRGIGQRKKAENEVLVSETKYRNLIENSGVVIYTTDVNGIISFVNSQTVELTGYAVEELVGKDFYFLLHPAWMQQVFNFYSAQFSKKTPTTTMEFVTRTKTGQQKWVEQTAQLVFENDRVLGFQCMVRDITEKKKIEIELKESETKRKEIQYRLEAILENTTALIFIKDLKGRYLMVNKRFKEVMRLTDEMVIGKTDYEISPKELADHYKASDDEVLGNGKPIETVELVETEHGPMNLLLIKFPLFDNNRNIFGISGIATNITDRAQHQQEQIDARKKAEDARQMQEQFLANMSHEMRTPMNGIQGMTNLLLETELSEPQKEFTNMIKRSVNSLLSMVNDVLDFSKIKAGKLAIEAVPFRINEILENVREKFAPRLEQKNLALQIQVESRVPQEVIGDPYRLNQILVNLLSNAIKFTEAGRIHITVLLLQQNGPNAVIQFAVKDTGMGIPEEQIGQIFESFTQANPEIALHFGGAGLGLAISKGLVQLQGGDIFVKSTLGEGSVFTFQIPYQLKHKEDKRSPVSEQTLLEGKRVLIVEDNEVNQKLVLYVLQKVGAKAEVAANGREAIDLYEAGKEYDLVIMDIQMPVMDGYETAIHMRQVLQLKTPIIAMTATALKGDQEKCMEVGMNDFMLKPFDFEDLYQRLIHLLYDDTTYPKLPMQNEKLYNLSLLEGLDDKASLLDVLTLFQENASAQIKEFPNLSAQQNWEALFQLAHKLKGAVAMLQADQLTDLLGKIEAGAKGSKDAVLIAEQVAEVCRLFDILKLQLEEEQELIRTELGITNV